jgi:hypothetical protein
MENRIIMYTCFTSYLVEFSKDVQGLHSNSTLNLLFSADNVSWEV